MQPERDFAAFHKVHVTTCGINLSKTFFKHSSCLS